jgi:two-component system sensor histidine kinase SenX3
VLVSFQLTAKTRGIELRADVGHGELQGCVDALGFERVVTNLVSNAIKFSGKGSHIDIALRRIGAGVVLTVQDHGVGMEPSDAQRLFQRYSRLAAHAGVSGSGLGLFIVKCIVSAHGGSIDVTSAVGQGTSFEVFFPDAPPCNERGEVLCLDFA